MKTDIQEGYPEYCKTCGSKLTLYPEHRFKPKTGQPMIIYKGICPNITSNKNVFKHDAFISEYIIDLDGANVDTDPIITLHDLRLNFFDVWQRIGSFADSLKE